MMELFPGLTLGDWIFLVILFFTIGLGVTVVTWFSDADDIKQKKKLIIRWFYNCVFVTIMGAGINWYHTHTASGIRAYKDFQSEIENGINREITITAEDGREIFHYEGKVDVETNHEDNYIKFESEDGRRYIVYYGIQDTILIVEKEKGE